MKLVHFHSPEEVREFSMGGNLRPFREIRKSLDGRRLARAHKELVYGATAAPVLVTSGPALALGAAGAGLVGDAGVNVARAARMNAIAKLRKAKRKGGSLTKKEELSSASKLVHFDSPEDLRAFQSLKSEERGYLGMGIEVDGDRWRFPSLHVDGLSEKLNLPLTGKAEIEYEIENLNTRIYGGEARHGATLRIKAIEPCDYDKEDSEEDDDKGEKTQLSRKGGLTVFSSFDEVREFAAGEEPTGWLARNTMGPLSAKKGKKMAAWGHAVKSSAGGGVLGAGVGATVGALARKKMGIPGKQAAGLGALLGADVGIIGGGLRAPNTRYAKEKFYGYKPKVQG